MNMRNKLTSRKFWMALALFVSGVITATGGTADAAETIVAALPTVRYLLEQGAAVIAYIIGEGLVDAGNTQEGA